MIQSFLISYKISQKLRSSEKFISYALNSNGIQLRENFFSKKTLGLILGKGRKGRAWNKSLEDEACRHVAISSAILFATRREVHRSPVSIVFHHEAEAVGIQARSAAVRARYINANSCRQLSRVDDPRVQIKTGKDISLASFRHARNINFDPGGIVVSSSTR